MLRLIIAVTVLISVWTISPQANNYQINFSSNNNKIYLSSSEIDSISVIDLQNNQLFDYNLNNGLLEINLMVGQYKLIGYKNNMIVSLTLSKRYSFNQSKWYEIYQDNGIYIDVGYPTTQFGQPRSSTHQSVSRNRVDDPVGNNLIYDIDQISQKNNNLNISGFVMSHQLQNYHTSNVSHQSFILVKETKNTQTKNYYFINKGTSRYQNIDRSVHFEGIPLCKPSQTFIRANKSGCNFTYHQVGIDVDIPLDFFKTGYDYDFEIVLENYIAKQYYKTPLKTSVSNNIKINYDAFTINIDTNYNQNSFHKINTRSVRTRDRNMNLIKYLNKNIYLAYQETYFVYHNKFINAADGVKWIEFYGQKTNTPIYAGYRLSNNKSGGGYHVPITFLTLEGAPLEVSVAYKEFKASEIVSLKTYTTNNVNRIIEIVHGFKGNVYLKVKENGVLILNKQLMGEQLNEIIISNKHASYEITLSNPYYSDSLSINGYLPSHQKVSNPKIYKPSTPIGTMVTKSNLTNYFEQFEFEYLSTLNYLSHLDFKPEVKLKYSNDLNQHIKGNNLLYQDYFDLYKPEYSLMTSSGLIGFNNIKLNYLDKSSGVNGSSYSSNGIPSYKPYFSEKLMIDTSYPLTSQLNDFGVNMIDFTINQNFKITKYLVGHCLESIYCIENKDVIENVKYQTIIINENNYQEYLK